MWHLLEFIGLIFHGSVAHLRAEHMTESKLNVRHAICWNDEAERRRRRRRNYCIKHDRAGWLNAALSRVLRWTFQRIWTFKNLSHKTPKCLNNPCFFPPTLGVLESHILRSLSGGVSRHCKTDSKLGSSTFQQHLPNMCWTQQESAWRYVRAGLCVRVGLSPRVSPCVFGMTWQPPALFKHGVGCARQPRRQAWLATGTRCARHPAEGEGRSAAGQAASNTSPTEPKAPLVGLWTPEQAQGEMIMRRKICVTRDYT